MVVMEEIVWYKNLDWSMIWACLAAIICLSLFIAMNPTKDIEAAKTQFKGVGNYFVNTWKNHAFNLISGFLVMAMVIEIAVPVMDWLIQKAMVVFGFKTEFKIRSIDEVAHFLAGISGLSGGFLIAKLIRRLQKLN